MKIFSKTHRGFRRDANQDRFLVKEFSNDCVLLAVADGAGGEAKGERAAEISKGSLANFDRDSEAIEAQFVKLMRAADQEIVEIVEEEPDLKGMGSTMTAAFVREGVVSWSHVGDSRLYLFRGDELTQITEDDTMAGFLLEEGEITKEEARNHPGRNFLFEFIGCGQLEPGSGNFALQEHDVLLLTTDGLHDKITEEVIVSILRSETDLGEKLETLVSTALELSGKDNVTVVGMEV
jgi:protein phosphatase